MALIRLTIHYKVVCSNYHEYPQLSDRIQVSFFWFILFKRGQPVSNTIIWHEYYPHKLVTWMISGVISSAPLTLSPIPVPDEACRVL